MTWRRKPADVPDLRAQQQREDWADTRDLLQAHGDRVLLREGLHLESGVIRPVLDRTFPFAETKEALAYVEAGRAVGKVVVVNQRSPA